MEPDTCLELKRRAQLKEKFTIDEQIQYLKCKGIKFDLVSDEDAKQYLSDNSYYFKVTSYRKNFEKDYNNLYPNIDFAHLKELAIIDMHLRHLLMCLTLDIEHCIKTHMIKLITSHSHYDGYKELKEYSSFHMNSLIQKQNSNSPKTLKTIDDLIMDKCKFDSGYLHDLSEKRSESPAIWILIELMSFGQLVNYVEYYYSQNAYLSTTLKVANEALVLCKNIRDSSAHNGTLISDITKKLKVRKTSPNANRQLPAFLRTYMLTKGISAKDYKQELKNLKVIDLLATIYIFDNYVKGNLRKSNIKKMKDFMDRASKNKEFFKDQNKLCNIYKLFHNIVESLG